MYGVNNNTGTPFQNHMNILKNNSTRNRITSAMKVSQGKSNILGDILPIINGIKQFQQGTSGGERISAIMGMFK